MNRRRSGAQVSRKVNQQIRRTERVELRVGQNEVIHDRDADDRPGATEAMCERDVFRTRGRIAGRMIVKQDHTGGPAPDRDAEDVARMGHRGVQSADRVDVCPQQPVFGVEQDQAEPFHRKRAKPGEQVIRAFERIDKLWPGRRLAGQCPAPQFQCGLHPCGLGVAHPPRLAQFISRQPGQPMHPRRMRERRSSQRHS